MSESNNHRRADVNLSGAELSTSSWVHTHQDGTKEITNVVSLEVNNEDSAAKIHVYVTEGDIDDMIAALREFKRNAVLTSREFAVTQKDAA